jgi:hypothetical protein
MERGITVRHDKISFEEQNKKDWDDMRTQNRADPVYHRGDSVRYRIAKDPTKQGYILCIHKDGIMEVTDFNRPYVINIISKSEIIRKEKTEAEPGVVEQGIDKEEHLKRLLQENIRLFNENIKLKREMRNCFKRVVRNCLMGLDAIKRTYDKDENFF